MNGLSKAGLWALFSILAFAWTGVACADYAEGYALYKSGDYAGALAAFSAVGEDQTEYITARYLMGLCYAKQGKDVEAKAEYEAVIAQSPEYGKAYTNQARVLLNLGEDQAALDAAQKGTEYAGDSGAYNVLGLACMRLEKYEEAIAAFKKGSELDPKNPWAFNNWGIALIRRAKDDPKQAAETAFDLFKKAVELDPKNELFAKNRDFAMSLMAP
jgi:tetratricopeptide (TPR) repeat protein